MRQRLEPAGFGLITLTAMLQSLTCPEELGVCDPTLSVIPGHWGPVQVVGHSCAVGSDVEVQLLVGV